MPGSLFRRESEQARSTRWLGRVVLIRPVSFTLITAWALVFAVLLAMFFIFGEYTRKARVSGVLAPREGVAKILAQQSGVVEAVHVKEGAHVRKDEPMVMLGDGRTARDRVELGVAVISRLEERRRALLDQREFAIAAADAEQSSFAQRRVGTRSRDRPDRRARSRPSARASPSRADGVERANRLEDIGFLSSAALDRERDVALDQESRLEQLQRARSSLLRDVRRAGVRVGRARFRAGGAQVAAIEMQRASLDQERVERESQFHAAIVAPTAGTVATVLVEPGQMVVAGTPLVAIVPAELDARGPALRAIAIDRLRARRRGGAASLPRLSAPEVRNAPRDHRRGVAQSHAAGRAGFTPVDGTREPVYRIKAALDSQAIRAYDQPRAPAAGHAIRGRHHARPPPPHRMDLRAAPGTRRKDVMDSIAGLRFGGGRRLPLFLQTEAAECGLASLGMVACFHGHRIDLAGMRRRFTVSLKGATLAYLMQVAGRLHLAPRPLKLELEELAHLRAPCILHWDLNHFVVLRSADARGAVDP